jgi:transposase
MSETLSLLGESLEAYRSKEETKTKEAPRMEAGKRFKPIDRSQVLLRPLDVEKLVEEDHPVRGIWAMVSRLDLKRLEQTIKAVEGRAGQNSFDPRMLMTLWIYGYSQGVSSARELSRMCDYEPACQWVTGLQAVNYHTLADFRVEHKEAQDEIFAQVLGLLSEERLIDLTRVMQDGTKVKAQAGAASFRREERIQQHLAMAREQVEAMGSPESEQLSQRVIRARQRAKQEKKERLERAVKELEELQKKRPEAERTATRVSETDPDARVMKQSDGGFAPSYNVQISTEASHKIVVAVGVTQAGTDYGQLIEGIDRVKANLGQAPAQAVVDGGYIKNENIEQMAGRGIELIGPVAANNPEASLQQRGISPEFYPDKFHYDPASDSFTCPAGKTLGHKHSKQREGRIEYHYRASEADCVSCPFRNQCCRKRSPRWVVRKEDSPTVKAFRSNMQTEKAKAIYRTRAEVAEFPNAWIKEKFGLRRFRLRGLAKTHTEAVWVCLTYNIKQWIRLRWMATTCAAA